MKRYVNAMLFGAVLMMLVGRLIGLADAQVFQNTEIEHHSPIVYFEQYRTVVPENLDEEFNVRVRILNANRLRYRINGFQMVFRFGRDIRFVEAVPPESGYFSARSYEDLTAGFTRDMRNWLENRNVPVKRDIAGISLEGRNVGRSNRRHGILVILKFRVDELSLNPDTKLEFVRLRLFYDSDIHYERTYTEPGILHPDFGDILENRVQVYNSILVRHRARNSKDANGDGQLNDGDANFVWQNRGNYLNREWRYGENRDYIDMLRACDLVGNTYNKRKPNGIIDNLDMREMMCLMMRNDTVCKFQFGQLKQNAVKK